MKFEIRNGSFSYEKGKEILKDVNFTMLDNTIISVLGSNGVGKTTLLKCILGLLKWKTGETLIDGRPISEMGYQEIWRKIGYVPQAKMHTFAYSVEEMVLLGRSAHLKMTEMPNENDRRIALECLDTIGASHLRHRLCSKISGGELQLVLIARALATCPSLLVLDEPESGLDFRNQLIVLNTIKDLRDNRGISSIINTHYPEHAVAISDMALILCGDGTSVCGNAREVITEAHLNRAFGVEVKIREVSLGDSNYTCIMPISIMPDYVD